MMHFLQFSLAVLVSRTPFLGSWCLPTFSRFLYSMPVYSFRLSFFPVPLFSPLKSTSVYHFSFFFSLPHVVVSLNHCSCSLLFQISVLVLCFPFIISTFLRQIISMAPSLLSRLFWIVHVPQEVRARNTTCLHIFIFVWSTSFYWKWSCSGSNLNFPCSLALVFELAPYQINRIQFTMTFNIFLFKVISSTTYFLTLLELVFRIISNSSLTLASP